MLTTGPGMLATRQMQMLWQKPEDNADVTRSLTDQSI